jgi:hypothetical protein
MRSDIINNLYLDIALIINNALYEQNKISYNLFIKTEKKLLKRIKKGE